MSPSRNDGFQTRDAKRARFSQKEEKSHGASPLVVAAGILTVVALLAGAVLILPGLTSDGAQAANRLAESSNSGSADGDVSASVAGSGLSGETPAEGPPATKAATAGHDPYPVVEAENGAVTFPMSTFDDGKAHHYTYMHEGQPIEFFVLKSSDGVVRAAFNACDVCFPAHLGYHQEGDEMVCNNCGRRFPSHQINVVEGGCNPSPLDRTAVGGTLAIGLNDLIQGMRYFEN